MAKHSRRLDQIADTPVSARRAGPPPTTSERERERCCWPTCAAPLWNEIPLCPPHLSIAAKLYAGRAAGEELVWRHAAVIEPEPIKEPNSQDGFVYYLRSSGFIKIGWTSDLTKRMKGYPPDSILMAVEPGSRQDETRRHRQFANNRTHGREWYTMSPSLMHHIDAVKAEHGEPEPVTFSAQPVGIPQPRQRQPIGRSASRMVRHVS
jgi:hypothetical protein